MKPFSLRSPLQIVQRRLANHRVTRAGAGDPAGVVRWLGAVQAQEFGPAKWGLGLRLPAGTTDAKIQRALDAGRILRTHVLRPTWHFVTPADIRWMLALSAAHVHRAMAPYDRRMGLEPGMYSRAAKICERVLRDRQFLTRKELGAHFARAGLPGSSFQLAHLVLYIELEGVVCSGPRRGKHSTYALLEERVPAAVKLSREEALGELAKRYFRSHGPATLRDFVWWSGLSTAEAKRGVEMNRTRKADVDGKTYWSLGRDTAPRMPRVKLLPVYDEYLVAYRDRDAVPFGPAMIPSRAGGYVQFRHSVIVDGQVAGTWRTELNGGVNVTPLRRLTAIEQRALRHEIVRYQRYVGGSADE